MKRVLVACEYSGRVRDAFRKLGYDAWSCDLLPAETPSPYHLQCDVRDVLDQNWDVLIAFPDCTYVCGSGIHWNDRGRGWEKTEAAVEFFRMLWELPIPHIALENPIGILSKRIGKPTQIIQPHQFGDDASKATCLWLKNLPSLSLRPATSRPGSSTVRSGGPTRPTAGRTASVHRKTAGKSGREPTKALPTRWLTSGTFTFRSNMDPLQGWKQVSFAGDCLGGDEDECGDICSVCGDDYADCECPGPTQDGMEYQEFNGILYARPTE